MLFRSLNHGEHGHVHFGGEHCCAELGGEHGGVLREPYHCVPRDVHVPGLSDGQHVPNDGRGGSVWHGEIHL